MNHAGLRFVVALAMIAPAASQAADVAPPAPGASSRLNAIKRRGTLRVAVLNEHPWLKRNPDGAGAPFRGSAWYWPRSMRSVWA